MSRHPPIVGTQPVYEMRKERSNLPHDDSKPLPPICLTHLHRDRYAAKAPTSRTEWKYRPTKYHSKIGSPLRCRHSRNCGSVICSDLRLSLRNSSTSHSAHPILPQRHFRFPTCIFFF